MNASHDSGHAREGGGAHADAGSAHLGCRRSFSVLATGCCRMRVDGPRGRTALHLAPPSSIASQVAGNYGLEVAASLPCSCIAGWMDRLLTTRSNGLMLTSRFVAHGGNWEHHSP
ncbi:hypothetical protein ZWY2020_000371 [Hordeum vulgare]|nr:hypothetical protein ZWY2020_000371 [Hordeum vulgare]